MASTIIIPRRSRATWFALHLFGLGLVAAVMGLAGVGALRGDLARAASTVTVQVGQTNGGSDSANEFNAASVTISLGDTVMFARFNGFHNVLSGEVPAGAGTFASATPIVAGAPFLFTPTAPGTYTYYCDVHEDPDVATLANIDASIAAGAMVGKVVVTGAAATATPTPDTPTPSTPTTPATATATTTATVTAPATSTATTTTTPTPGGTTVQVGQRPAGTAGAQFNPASVTINPGGTVNFARFAGSHNVISVVVPAGAAAFASGPVGSIMAAGELFPVTLTVSGTYTYYCEIHNAPDEAQLGNVDANIAAGMMVGKVVVTGAAPTATATATTTATATATATSTPPPPAAPGTVQVIDNDYSPKSITVAPGASVKWVNVGARKHTVTANDASYDSGLMSVGAEWSRTFPTAGTFEYYCDLHTGMTGTVVVGTGGGGGTSTATPTPEPTPLPPAAPGSVQVIDYDYAPKDLTVSPGALVRFINLGAKKHTVTASDGSFDSGLMATGDAYSRTFEAAGYYPYYCDLHPDMIGSVTVSETAGPSTWPPIPGLPDGLLYNEVWNPKTGKYTVTYVSSAAEITTGNSAFWGLIMQGVRNGTITAADLPPHVVSFVEAQYSRLGGPPASFAGKKPAATSTPSAPPTPGSGAPAVNVDVIDFDYSPKALSVAVGGAVKWVNVGAKPHTVTASDGSFDSGLMVKGDAYSRTFSTAGTFEYFCDLHPAMVATVTVGGGGSGVPAAKPTTPPAPPTFGNAGEVLAIDFDYAPRTALVNPGTTIRFVNAGIARHTVTAIDESWDSGLMAKGDAYSHTFATPGTYDYFCILHPEMVGSIQVADSAGAVPPAASVPNPSTSRPTVAVAPGDVQAIDFDYSPKIMTVSAGASIRFVNTGIAPHTITALDNSFDSGFMAKGDAYTRAFPTPGTFDYFCIFHPAMVGTVRVLDATGAAPAPLTAMTAPTTPAGPAVAAGSSAASVALLDLAYEPRKITVKPGTEVTWTNTSLPPHTITMRDGSFDSGLIKRGESFSRRFEAQGTFEYFCTLHPGMEGTVVVGESGPTITSQPRVTSPGINASSDLSSEAARNILIAVWAMVVVVFLVGCPTIIYAIRSSRT